MMWYENINYFISMFFLVVICVMVKRLYERTRETHLETSRLRDEIDELLVDKQRSVT